MAQLIHELVIDGALRTPAALALRHAGANHSYAALAAGVEAAGAGLMALGVARHDRIAVWLPQSEQAVHALLGAAAAGAAFVPLAPHALPQQSAAILRDSGARMLVTTADRLAALTPALAGCRELGTVLVCGGAAPGLLAVPGVLVLEWEQCLRAGPGRAGRRCIATDMAALVYMAGSSGRPKGVVLSHRDLVAGAHSAARHLGNTAHDRLLTALPFSLDYGLNQLTSAFAAGAAAVLCNHTEPRAIVGAVERAEITGLAAVPPMWIDLAHEDWSRAGATLRYLTSCGGALPRTVLDALRRALPCTRIYLMSGLTEAFRSTGLAPDQLDLRPESIGKPVPDAELLVLGPDGQPGMPRAETALWSGDPVCSDDVIRTSGHRVSPADVEEVVYGSGLLQEAAAVDVAHPVLGQVIAVLATPRPGCRRDSALLFGACRAALPGHMLPAMADVRRAPLPRNPHGQIGRALLAGELAPLFAEAAP